jgi:hypothetical protein
VLQESSWKRMWIINFIFLALLLVSLLILSVLHIIEITFALCFVLPLSIFALILFFRQKSNIQSRPDERMKRIVNRATNISWQLTAVVMAVLYWLDYSKVLLLSSAQVLSSLALFMALSFIIIYLILRRLGDVSE